MQNDKRFLNKSKLNILSSVANQLVTMLCGIITPRVLLSAFGSEAYGIAVSITQFLAYISLLESGIGGVARAKLYSPLFRRDYEETAAVVAAIKHFFHYVAAAFCLYSLFLGVFYHDIARITLFPRAYIFALVMVIGIATLVKYMGGLANLTLIVADQRLYVVNCIAVTTTIANTAAIIILTRLHCDLIWVKLGSSLIFILRPLFYILYVKKHYSLHIDRRKRAVLEQKWTGIGQHLAYFLHRNTDIVLLTLFSDIRLVAVYSVYSLIVNSVRTVTESFSGGMEAAFGEVLAKQDLRRLQSTYHRYHSLLTGATVVLFSCTGLLIVPFVMLYTSGISDAEYVQPWFALVLIIAEAINCLMLPCSSLAVAANHFKQTRVGAYGESVINIAVSCILIQWNPLLGVAIGTLVATIFRGMFYLRYSSKNLLRMPPRKLLLRFLAALTVMLLLIAIGSALLRHVEISNYYQWIIYGAVSFALIGLPLGYFTLCSMRKGKQAEMKGE